MRSEHCPLLVNEVFDQHLDALSQNEPSVMREFVITILERMMIHESPAAI